jgi:hypothetical protein
VLVDDARVQIATNGISPRTPQHYAGIPWDRRCAPPGTIAHGGTSGFPDRMDAVRATDEPKGGTAILTFMAAYLPFEGRSTLTPKIWLTSCGKRPAGR